ncbi:MAG: hypothetical protein R3C19_02185 [Planctomycetaceae bacterium]
MAIKSSLAVFLTLTAAASAITADDSLSQTTLPVVPDLAVSSSDSIADKSTFRKPAAAPIPSVAAVANVKWADLLPEPPANNNLQTKPVAGQNVPAKKTVTFVSSAKTLTPAVDAPSPKQTPAKVQTGVPGPAFAPAQVGTPSPADTKTAANVPGKNVAAGLPNIPDPSAGLSEAHAEFSKQTARPAFAESELVTLSFSKSVHVSTSAVDVSNTHADELPTLKMPAGESQSPATSAQPVPETTLAAVRRKAEALKASKELAKARVPNPERRTVAVGVFSGTATQGSQTDAFPRLNTVTISPDVAETPASRMVPKFSFTPIPVAPGKAPAKVALSKSPAGGSKATTAPAPSVEQITSVNWSVNPALLASDYKPKTVVSFSATECPFLMMSVPPAVGVSPNRLQQIAQDANATLPVPGTDTVAPKTLAAVSGSRSTGGVPADIFSELKQLVPQEPIEETPSSETYLSDLESLLTGDSPWVMVNNAPMVDLAPHEPEPQPRLAAPAYVDELHALLPQNAQQTPRASSIPVPQQYKATAGRPQDRAYDEAPAGGTDSPSSSNFTAPRQADPAGDPGSKTLDALFRPISQVSVNGISTQAPDTAAAKLPEDQAIAYADLTYPHFYNTSPYFAPRRLSRNTYPFQCHPLYFEDPNLERCGQSNGCLTTLGSAVHFYSLIAVTPYLTTVDHPRDCVRTLPDCPTCHEFAPEDYLPEWSWKAAAVQAGAVTGLFYIIP